MTSLKTILWRASIRTKILVPSIVLFIIFAVTVTFFFNRTYTQRMEAELAEKLQRDGALLQKILHDEERRIALRARFMADMVRFSEQFPGTTAGSSVLIYMLEYLQQTDVEIRVYSRADLLSGALGELVRKGLLGIRTNALVEYGSDAGRVMAIAGVSPVERASGTSEVIVTSYPLSRARLRELKDKLGVDLAIVHEGVTVTSTLTDPNCVQVFNQAIDAEMQQSVLEAGERVIQDIFCANDPRRAIFLPLEIGFEHRAIYVVSLSLQEILDAKRRVTGATALSAGVTLLVIALIYSILVRRFTQPLKNLASMTERVGERDYGPGVPVESGDEVGELAGSFNTMVRRLEKSERELERLHEKEMERANRMATIGELASSIAHEIRNPLAGIGGAIRVLRSDKALSDNRRELLEEVDKQIERMDRLTRDLLDYSKPAPARLVFTDVHGVLDSALFLTPLNRAGSRYRVRKEYELSLPKIQIDPSKIQQVVLNILLNAIQAMDDDGEVVIKTSAGGEKAGRRLLVEIADNGVGMSAETLENALRPFFTTKKTGTGLGLAIGLQIMESHGGSIAMRSEEGKGTTFTLLFPI